MSETSFQHIPHYEHRELPTKPSPSLSMNFSFLNSRSPSNHDLEQEALMEVLVEDIE